MFGVLVALMTRGESDTESVRTVLAEGYPEDPAEEDDVISERGLEGHSSDDGTGARREAFTSLDEVVLFQRSLPACATPLPKVITHRFGTLTSPPPLVRDIPWGPHPPGHLEEECIRDKPLSEIV